MPKNEGKEVQMVQAKGEDKLGRSQVSLRNTVTFQNIMLGKVPVQMICTMPGKVSPHISVMVQLQFLSIDASFRGGRTPKSRKLLSSGV